MRTIVDFLGTDHRACDDLFASAEDAVPQKDWDSERDSVIRSMEAVTV